MSDDITPILLDDDAWIDDALLEEQWLAAEMAKRPKTRAECIDGPRPCPWYSCRYHLGLNISSCGTRVMVSTEPEDLDDSTETCALDVASRGPLTLEQIGAFEGVGRERVRQVETEAFEKLQTNGKLAALIDSQPVDPEDEAPSAPERPGRTWSRRDDDEIRDAAEAKARRSARNEQELAARLALLEHVRGLVADAGGQAFVAKRIGVSVATLSAWTMGGIPRSAAHAERLGALHLMKPIVEAPWPPSMAPLAWRSWCAGVSLSVLSRNSPFTWIRNRRERSEVPSASEVEMLDRHLEQMEAAA